MTGQSKSLSLLPPTIEYSRLVGAIGEARASLGNLQGSMTNPRINRELLITPFMTKEAVRSSAIEGTIASLEDVLRHEASEDSIESNEIRIDAVEIVNYREALTLALDELEHRAIGENLLKKAHFVLLDSVRGQKKSRGEFRTQTVWIGRRGAPIEKASYVPPSPEEIPPLMKNWEQYINSRDEADPLVQLAIAHYQFEAIHPFLDGNGRIGRLVIPLFLYDRELLGSPVLYVSEYFEENRIEYINALRGVDNKGEWESWIEFFLQAISVQAQRTLETMVTVENLYEELVPVVDGMGLTYARPTLDILFRQPILGTKTVRQSLGASDPTVYRLFERFEQAGIIREITNRARRKVYFFGRLVDLLS